MAVGELAVAFDRDEAVGIGVDVVLVIDPADLDDAGRAGPGAAGFGLGLDLGQDVAGGHRGVGVGVSAVGRVGLEFGH